ncbi:hypothetical protein TRVA0_006S00166 [Trichomonascus vanleenenianus]|uniref:uncharacterized protein n=1 Tax=Trichomonascus vanleenenianus TaxID=2268995 RepID=UPI003ECAC429
MYIFYGPVGIHTICRYVYLACVGGAVKIFTLPPVILATLPLRYSPRSGSNRLNTTEGEESRAQPLLIVCMSSGGPDWQVTKGSESGCGVFVKRNPTEMIERPDRHQMLPRRGGAQKQTCPEKANASHRFLGLHHSRQMDIYIFADFSFFLSISIAHHFNSLHTLYRDNIP